MIFMMFLNITFLINVEEPPTLKVVFVGGGGEGGVSPTYMVTVPVSDCEPDKSSFNFLFL